MKEPTWWKPYRYERPPFGEFGAFLMVGERLVCHVCGRDYLNLQTHVWAMHGLTADAYRGAFGLYSATPLWAKSMSKRMSESNERRMRAEPLSLKAMSQLALVAERQRKSGLRRPRKPLNEATRRRIGAAVRARWALIPAGTRSAKGVALGEAWWAMVRRDWEAGRGDREMERRRKISVAQKGRKHTWGAPGERNGQAKLTWGQVGVIRAASAEGRGLNELATRYGVSRSLIWLIVRGKIWVPA